MVSSSSPAFELVNAHASPGFIFVCDHASNAIPSGYANLGLTPAQCQTHIAWDIGAAAVTRALANAFAAPAILGTYSRLLIDLNRGADDPTLVMKLSDGAVISGNANADQGEIANRVTRYYQPYHDAIEAQIDRARALSIDPCIISVHSFTPQWKAHPRPWQIGVLWSEKDRRLSDAMLARLRREPDLVIGDNQPYSGELDGDCMAQHALSHGFRHVLIEIRQDLIALPDAASHWAQRLVPVLKHAAAETEVQGQNHMNDPTRTEIEAAVFRRLVSLLQQRTDVQNIDLMNLAGFCRNCLGNWLEEAATARGEVMSRDEAREKIYGMPYAEWKSCFQKDASAAQKQAFDLSHKNHG